MVDETELKNELNKCKKRFKGVENFIRRVAFNLGNTPSQTEVKIISCIPIDVTDLQQKIVQLERQLEDARNKSVKDDNASIGTAKSVKDNGDNKSRVSKDDANKPNETIEEEPDQPKKDSKGEKDKLTKSSKSDGVKDKSKKDSKAEVKDKSKKNSKGDIKDKSKKDSKTDVKEKSKKDSKADIKEKSKKDSKADIKEKSKKESKADTKDKSKKDSKADTKDKTKKDSKADIKDKSKKDSKADLKDKSKKDSKGDIKDKSKKDSKTEDQSKKNSKAEVKDKSRKNSKCSNKFCRENQSVHTAFYGQNCPRLRGIADSLDSELLGDSYTSRLTDSSSIQYDSTASSMFPTTSTIPNTCRYILRGDSKFTGDRWSPKTIKKLFSKKKKLRKNKTHFVYYAQTNHSPFNSYELTSDSVSNNHGIFDCNYLSEIIKKQYQPIPIVEDLSNNSKLTSPVCRDEHQNPDTCSYESDVCSCFRGMFYDVDKYLSQNSAIQSQLKINNDDIYNDSSLYDVIPVKENSHCKDSSKEKDFEIEMKCWPENIRVKTRPHPFIVNYHTITRDPENYVSNKFRKSPDRNRQKGKLNKKQFKEEQTCMTSSNNASVDLTDMCTKITVPKTKNTQTSAPIQSQNNELRKIPINNIQAQNLTRQQDIVQENKAEATLGQIKSILKTVLTEVRENALRNVEEKVKKDVNLQKGSSQSNMQEGSSLLNSFTYSPYNMNPQQPTCSKQMASNQCCYQGVPQMQNYPLIIQTPGRHLCSSCFRNSQNKPSRKNNPLVPINTEKIKEQRYNETDKLIREIYKSVALDIPTKDTSGSEYNLDMSNTEKETAIKPQNNESKKTGPFISEIFLNRNIKTDTSESNAVSATAQEDSVGRNSKLSTINSNNTQTEFSKEDKNIQLSMDTDSETVVAEKVECRVANYKRENKKESSSEDESDESSSENDSGRTVVSIKKEKEKKKPGLFSKMMNIFIKKKTDNDTKVESDAESSDSDDYQTVYSQKVDKPKRHHKHVIQITKKPHSKTTRPKRLRKTAEHKTKRRPYMEQEYRRHWNEKIMFENEKVRHSSEQPFWWETTKKARREPVYHQNIEARNVLVEPAFDPMITTIYDRLPRYPPPESFSYRQAPSLETGYYGFPNNPNYGPPHPYRETTNVQNAGNPPIPMTTRDLQMSYGQTTTASQEKNKNFGLKKDEKKNGLAWLKKYNLGVRCGEQWKKFILEN